MSVRPQSRKAQTRRFLSGLVAFAVAVGLMSAVPLAPGERAAAAVAATRAVAEVPHGGARPQAVALNGADFDPGYIISDSEFYSTDAMSAAEIQAFLDSKCPQNNCLNRVTVSSFSRGATNMCPSPYVGVPVESAAAVIFKVQQSCGISARALLVILQKEQSLVTRNNPSAGVLQIAMGYGCPDTSACDTEFYGFYNQVYNAASQLKRYGLRTSDNTSFRTRYQIGVPYPILYNPNAACGTLTVTVQNMATTALYYYTPYTPNGPALANMPGLGDGCSSYGNRNFWYFYTSWFGSTGGSALARSAGDPTIYVINADSKYPVRTTALFTSLSALGPYRTVSQSSLDRLTTGPDATNVLRDMTSGSIYMAADGVKNPFPTCALVAAYFSTCYAYIDLPSSALRGFATGPTLTQFVTAKESGVTYFVANATKRAVFDPAAKEQLAQGGSTASVAFRQTLLEVIPSGPDVLVAGIALKVPGAEQIYLTTSPTTAVKVANVGILAAFGVKSYSTSAGTLSNLTVATGNLSVAITCGTSATFVAGGGMIWPTVSTGGLPVTALNAATCATIPKSSQSVTGPLFLRVPSSGSIYHVDNGKKQFMSSMAQITAIAGSSPLIWVTTSQDVLDTIPTQTETLRAGELVKSATDPTIYLVDGASAKVPVPSFAILSEFGLSTGFSIKNQETLDRYVTAPTPLSPAVTCGSSEAFVAGGGRLWSVADSGGLPLSALDPATCAVLTKSSQTVTGALFMREPVSGYIYNISGGKKLFMSTMAQITALNGSNPLVWINSNTTVLDSIPSAAETIPVASLVKGPSDPTVFLIDGGSTKIPVPSFALVSEFGVRGYHVKSQSILDAYTTAPTPFSLAVTCGSAQVFVGGGGLLWPVATTGGLAVTPLDPATCATVPTASQSISGPLFLRVTSTGYIYQVLDGKKYFMSTMAQIIELNGSNPLLWVPTNQTVVDAIPNG